MNHAHNDKPAASGTARGRLARLARLGVVACVLAATGAGALAQAQDRNVRRDESAQVRERYQMQAQQDPRYEQRVYEMREQERRALEAQAESARDDRRRGRLSPDERRDLRRQIKEGADLYPTTQRR